MTTTTIISTTTTVLRTNLAVEYSLVRQRQLKLIELLQQRSLEHQQWIVTLVVDGRLDDNHPGQAALADDLEVEHAALRHRYREAVDGGLRA